MQMSDGEILHSWNNAAKPAEHVQILADLNAVSKEEMREKLLELGAEGVPAGRKKRTPKATGDYKPVKLDELRAMQLYNDGLCDLDMAEALGVKPEECLMVGDRPLDTEAGMAAGVTSVLLDAEDRFPDGKCDLRIDAPGLLSRLIP